MLLEQVDRLLEEVRPILVNYLSKPIFGQQLGGSRLVEESLQDFLVGSRVINEVLPNGLNSSAELTRCDSPDRGANHLFDGDEELFDQIVVQGSLSFFDLGGDGLRLGLHLRHFSLRIGR